MNPVASSELELLSDHDDSASSTSREATSRYRTSRAEFMASSTARSTTSLIYGTSCRAAGTASGPVRIPKRSCTRMKKTRMALPRPCEACLRLVCGMSDDNGSCWFGTDWARSRSSTPTTTGGFCSDPRSRPCSPPIQDLRRRTQEHSSPTSRWDSSPGKRRCSVAFESCPRLTN